MQYTNRQIQTDWKTQQMPFLWKAVGPKIPNHIAFQLVPGLKERFTSNWMLFVTVLVSQFQKVWFWNHLKALSWRWTYFRTWSRWKAVWNRIIPCVQPRIHKCSSQAGFYLASPHLCFRKNQILPRTAERMRAFSNVAFKCMIWISLKHLETNWSRRVWLKTK